jgi:hypothetical protein
MWPARRRWRRRCQTPPVPLRRCSACRRPHPATGGVKGGQVIGATDEFGFRAVEDRIHVNDLHATILGLLGLDHERLTFLFQGRQQRLTDVGGSHEFADRLLR